MITLYFKAPKEALFNILESLEESGIEVKHGSYPEFFVEDREIEECLQKGIDPRNLGADKRVVVAKNVRVIYEDPFIKGDDETLDVWIEINCD